MAGLQWMKATQELWAAEWDGGMVGGRWLDGGLMRFLQFYVAFRNLG